MVDPAFGAMLVAVLSVPLVISPVPLQALKILLRWILTWLQSARTRCEVLCWTDLSQMPVQSCSRPCCAADAVNQPRHDLLWEPEKCYVHSFQQVLKLAWPRNTLRTVAKPSYLALDTNYLRTDGNTLLTYILLISSSWAKNDSSYDLTRIRDTITFRAGGLRARFHTFNATGVGEMYLVGHLDDSSHRTRIIKHCAAGLVKEEILSIIDGFPPFYRRQLTTLSGVPLDFPVHELADARRGGWLLAAGLCIHEPTNVYNSRFDSSYEEACTRVLRTLTDCIFPLLVEGSPDHRSCQAAIASIRHMNSCHSDSGGDALINHSAISGCIGHRIQEYTRTLRAEDCLLAFKLFQRHNVTPLAQSDFRVLEPLLPGVLAAAVRGVHRWWAYHSDIGSALPSWLLADSFRNAPIWLKDCHKRHM